MLIIEQEAAESRPCVRLEWPPGSGRFADYDHGELLLVSEILAGDDRRAAMAEVEWLHSLKVDHGVRVLPREERTMAVCPECEIGGGYHVDGCSRAGQLELIDEPEEEREQTGLFVAPDQLERGEKREGAARRS